MKDYEAWLEAIRDQGIFRAPEVKVEADEERGILYATVRVDPILFYGRSAGELRAAGFLKGHDDIPDCAVLGPGGFEWVQVDFTLRLVDQDNEP